MSTEIVVDPHEILASQTAIINAAIRHKNTYGVLPEAPAPYFLPNVAETVPDAPKGFVHVLAPSEVKEI